MKLIIINQYKQIFVKHHIGFDFYIEDSMIDAYGYVTKEINESSPLNIQTILKTKYQWVTDTRGIDILSKRERKIYRILQKALNL
jgi:hypothetical protein